MAFQSNFRIPPFHTDSHPCIRIGGPVAYIGGPVAKPLLGGDWALVGKPFRDPLPRTSSLWKLMDNHWFQEIIKTRFQEKHLKALLESHLGPTASDILESRNTCDFLNTVMGVCAGSSSIEDNPNMWEVSLQMWTKNQRLDNDRNAY